MFITTLGLVAAVLTTSSFLPQVIQCWKTKETKDVSLSMYLILTIGTLMWTLYGIVLQAPPVYLANAITSCLTIFMIYLKIRHG